MNDDYTPENLDREILEWYSKIDTSKLGEALNVLMDDTRSLSFRVLSRLQALSVNNLGLWITWKESSSAPPFGGYFNSLARSDRKACYAKELHQGLVRVPYSNITEVSLKLPSHRQKSKKKWEEAITQVLNIQHETIRLIDSVLETVSDVADKSFGKDEFDMSSHQVYSKMYDLAKSIEQVREQLKENSLHE